MKLILKSNAFTYKKIYTLCNDLFEIMQFLYITSFCITYSTSFSRCAS